MLKWIKKLFRKSANATGCVIDAHQIYGGPLDGQWTTLVILEGYTLSRDIYSDRLYFIWNEDLRNG